MNSAFKQTTTVASWNRNYYHPIAEEYYDIAIPTMLKLMGAERGDMVLEAGCGQGVHTIRAVKSGYRITAIDISKTMLSEAARRVAAAGAGSSVEFRQEDLTELTLADASFKYAFSWGAIIHIPEAKQAMSELARVVAPGGSLALYVSNNDSWDKKLEDFARRILRKPLSRENHTLGSGVWYDMHGEKLWVWHFDVKALEKELANQGFHLTHRIVGEYSEIQHRVKGPIRSVLLKANNLFYFLRVSPRHAGANLLVFRKAG